MIVLIISYDLNKEKKDTSDYEAFYKVIQSFDWIKLSASAYAIATNITPAEVYNMLFPNIDSNDHVYVVTLCQPYRGSGSDSIDVWLKDHLEAHSKFLWF